MIIPSNYPFVKDLLKENNYVLSINPENITIWQLDNPRNALVADITGIAIRKEEEIYNFDKKDISSIQFTSNGSSKKLNLIKKDAPPCEVLEIGNPFRPFSKEDGEELSLFLAEIFNDQFELV